MRFPKQTPSERLIMMRTWRRKFALFPVRVAENEVRWLEFVEMRYYRKPWRASLTNGVFMSFSYARQYRAIGSTSWGFPGGVLAGEVEPKEKEVDKRPPPSNVISIK